MIGISGTGSYLILFGLWVAWIISFGILADTEDSVHDCSAIGAIMFFAVIMLSFPLFLAFCCGSVFYLNLSEEQGTLYSWIVTRLVKLWSISMILVMGWCIVDFYIYVDNDCRDLIQKSSTFVWTCYELLLYSTVLGFSTLFFYFYRKNMVRILQLSFIFCPLIIWLAINVYCNAQLWHSVSDWDAIGDLGCTAFDRVADTYVGMAFLAFCVFIIVANCILFRTERIPPTQRKLLLGLSALLYVLYFSIMVWVVVDFEIYVSGNDCKDRFRAINEELFQTYQILFVLSKHSLPSTLIMIVHVWRLNNASEIGNSVMKLYRSRGHQTTRGSYS